MWIMIPAVGFLSAVADKNDPALVMIRARRRGDLVKLIDALAKVEHPIKRKAPPIVRTPHADYPFRIFIHRADFAEVLALAVDDLSYTNFKSEVARLGNRDHEHAYHEVWAVLRGLEEKEARKP